MARIDECSGYLRGSDPGLEGVEAEGRACPQSAEKILVNEQLPISWRIMDSLLAVDEDVRMSSNATRRSRLKFLFSSRHPNRRRKSFDNSESRLPSEETRGKQTPLAPQYYNQFSRQYNQPTQTTLTASSTTLIR